MTEQNDRVQGFNAKGEYISSFGEEGEAEGQLKNPGGIALAAEGKVWIADTGNHRVSGWKKVVSRASYVQGANGLVEQRTAGETSFPLADAHGDVTAIADPAGEVSSRQSYDPWGAQLSGPTLEMGYLGAQQRRFDPTSGLIQMGARSYAPQLGAFLSEDPVLTAVGIGISANRYPYAWDNPLYYLDLDGRFPSPAGLIQAGQDVGNALGSVANAGWNAAGDGVDAAWDWTAPGRQWVSDRAQDFVKSLKEQCGMSFWDRAADNFVLTNEKFLGLAAPTFSSGKINERAGVARSLGTQTPSRWIVGAVRGSRGGKLAALPRVAGAASLSWLASSAAWELGVGIGSLARAGLAAAVC